MKRFMGKRFYILLGTLMFFFGNLASGYAAHHLAISNDYRLIAKHRVGRTIFEFTYKATIVNGGEESYQNVKATLESTNPHTLIVDGDLDFGMVQGGASVTSSDTFTIRLDRRYPCNIDELSWQIEATSESKPVQVYVGSEAGIAEQYAADELVKFLNQANIEVHKTHEFDPQQGRYIIVGNENDYVAGRKNSIDPSVLGEDGFVFVKEGENLLISGAHPRGTLNGVYQYLRKYIGYEWYALDTVKVPHFEENAQLSMPDGNETHVPRFVYRAVFNPEAGEPQESNDAETPGGDFAARIHLNGLLGHKGYFIDEEGQYHKGLLRAKHGFGINRISVYDIENEPGTSDATLEAAIAGFRNVARYRDEENQTGLWYPSVVHIDGGSRSEDPDDLELVAANGGAAGAPLMHLTKRLAEAVQNEFPEAIVLGEAYLWSLKPPTNINLPSNAGVAFAPIEADWAQPIDGPNNTQLYEYLQEWTNHTDHIWSWLYITNFSGYLQPLPTIYPMIETIKKMAELPDVEGLFLQDSYSTKAGSFAALHTWVYARLMWDPALDGDLLIQEFCNNYYGPQAGPIIYRYIQELHQSLKNNPSRINTKAGLDLPYLNAAFLIKADSYMDQAERAASGNPLFLKHVQIERMGVDWVMLLNWAKLKAQAENEGLVWPDATEQERLERVERFKNVVKNVALMEDFGEGTGDIDTLLASLQYPRIVPAPPVNCETGDTYIDYQDINFKLSEAQLVYDEAASDHGAARMVGSTDAWGIQIPFQMLLPETGQWDVYVAVKIDPNDGADEDAAAILVGVDGTPHNREIPLKALADGKYHILQVTGNPYSYNAQQTLWVAPPNSDTIDYLYVDRVFAVPAGSAESIQECPQGGAFQNCQMLEECGLKLFMEASSIVKDDKAKDGFAAFVHGGSQGWWIQADLDKLLPEDGDWDIYASARIDRLAAVGDEEKAFDLGIEGGDEVTVTVGQLSDGQYHLIKLPVKNYMRGDHKALYISPDNGKIRLYVDFIFAVPASAQQGVTPELASAFLARATFGPTMEEIEELAESNDLEGWIEEQFTIPPSFHLNWMQAHTNADLDAWDKILPEIDYAQEDAWWINSIDSKDQLRQRVAFALSEIFVVSRNSGLLPYADGLSHYYDILVENAFGNFKTILKAVAKSPMMGTYLSYLGNAKASEGRHPDENFAREVMQLFTIGLYQLNQDGTYKLKDGKRIPTYGQKDIMELARIFTGWTSDNGVFPAEGGFPTLHSRIAEMVTDEEEHDSNGTDDLGGKLVLGHIIPAGQTAEQDLDSALDILFHHDNVGPFIARRLIQRLVTSNPSPEYIGRVAAAFNDNGHGVRGDMKAVIKAILLDPEALNGADTMPATFGKVREPLLFITNLWRAFHAQKGKHQVGPFEYDAYGYRDSGRFLQQRALSALTVFNFFTPDDRPQDLFDDEGNELFAPEMSVMGIDGLHTVVMEYSHETGEYEVDEITASLDLSEEIQLLEEGADQELVNRLNVLLLAGHMSADLRQALLDHIALERNRNLGPREIVQDLISLVMLSAEYAVQR